MVFPKKRGMSEVITVLLIVLIIFVAIMIIWIVLRNLIERQTELSGAQAQLLQADIRVQGIRIDGARINMSLRNFAGKTITQYEETQQIPAGVDVISVVDLSGSMRCSNLTYPPGPGECYFNQTACEGICGGIWLGPINSLKQANLNLVSTILENNLSKIGLVAYNESIIPASSYDLDNNSIILNNIINNWFTNGSTCICCGIINATGRFQVQSSDSTKKAMIVMSDGVPTLGYNCGLGGNGIGDTITAACNANSSLENLTIYSVGLGGGINETLLRAVAACGNGQYFPAININELIAVYEIIAQQIIQSQSQSINSFERLLFSFYNNESESAQIRVDNIPGVLEIENYEFDLTGILEPEIIKIEVYPVIIDSSGEEIIGQILTSWERQ